MSRAEAWLDLMAAALLPPAADGPVVVVAESHAWLPQLAHRAPMAWIHSAAPALTDFTAAPHRLPASRLRLGLDQRPTEAFELMQRAALAVVILPEATESQVVTHWLGDLIGAASPWLVAGPAHVPGWHALAWASQGDGMALPAPAGWRCWVGGVLAAASQRLRLGAGLDASLLQRLIAAAGPGAPAQWQGAAQGTHLRLRPPAVDCLALLGEPILHQVLVQNRALIGPRGHAAVVLPWGGVDRVKLLLRNVRSRIDQLQAVLGERDLLPAGVQYTEHGALVDYRLPPATAMGAGWRDALLHLALPSAALPQDDFCDVGAVEFSLEMRV